MIPKNNFVVNQGLRFLLQLFIVGEGEGVDVAFLKLWFQQEQRLNIHAVILEKFLDFGGNAQINVVKVEYRLMNSVIGSL